MDPEETIVDNTLTPEALTPDPAPAVETPATEPAEPFQGLTDALDAVGKPDAPEVPAVVEPVESKAETPPAAPVVPPEPKAEEMTPPEGMSERANARWTALADRAKQVPVLEQRATAAESELTSVRTMVQQSGLEPNEFQGMLEMGRLYKSQNPKDLESALQQLDGLRADIATRLGVDAPGLDLLAVHPDLKAKVDGLTLSREDAIEMVRLRSVQTNHQTAQRVQQDQQQFETQVSSAAREMDAILAQRAATPGHEAKVGHIRGYFSDPAKLQSFVSTYEPKQWKAAVLMMYDTYQPPAPPAHSTARQPLRPTATGAGQRVTSTTRTAEDAVSGAFERLGL